MPLADSLSPALDRAAASPQAQLAIASITAATDLFVVAANPLLDRLQTGDVVKVVGTLTGGAGLVLGKLYYLIKVAGSSTTFKLSATPGGAPLDVTSDMSAGAPVLQYGNEGVTGGSLSTNIVGQGSPAGGAFNTPLD